MTAENEYNLSYDDIYQPNYRIEHSSENYQDCRNFYLEVYEKSPVDSSKWRSAPPDRWHLLARIFSDRIETHPVYTSPHAARYLKPKHGRFETVIIERQRFNGLPETIYDAFSEIGIGEGGLIFDSYSDGLGLIKELKTAWTTLSSIPNINTIVIRNKGISEIDGNLVFITKTKLNEIRKAFNRGYRRSRERLNLAKRMYVRNELLSVIDPDKFPRIVEVNDSEQLVEIKLAKANSSNATQSNPAQSTIENVREKIETLASESPKSLLALHSDIERITLKKMIERYEALLKKNLSENHWQQFFENNIFVLTMIFARPVHLLKASFHADPSKIAGSGAQIGDFLYAQGQSLAIVEIKKPSKPLMNKSPYRNDIYSPNSELSGSITQVLSQQNAMRSNWLYHKAYETETLKNSFPDVIKCVVIAGRTPVDEKVRRSFDMFRNACKDVEVITYDELLSKLQMLLDHLTPKEIDNEPPF